MPELPGKLLLGICAFILLPHHCYLEVERAVALVRLIGKGNTITRVETSEDNIVFQGLPSHEDFVCPPRCTILSSDGLIRIGQGN